MNQLGLRPHKSPPADKRHTKPCRYFQSGHCRLSEDECDFAHVIAHVTPTAIPKPCKYFLAGSCGNGDLCRFQHSPDGDISSESSPTAIYCPHHVGHGYIESSILCHPSQHYPLISTSKSVGPQVYEHGIPFGHPSIISPVLPYYSPSIYPIIPVPYMDHRDMPSSPSDLYSPAPSSDATSDDQIPDIPVVAIDRESRHLTIDLDAANGTRLPMYPHSLSPIKELPTPRPTTRARSKSAPTKQKLAKYKTKPCKFWCKENGCPNGNSCTFLHGNDSGLPKNPGLPAKPISEKEENERRGFYPVQWRVIGGGVKIGNGSTTSSNSVDPDEDMHNGARFSGLHNLPPAEVQDNHETESGETSSISLPLKVQTVDVTPRSSSTSVNGSPVRARSNSIPSTPIAPVVETPHFSAESP